MKIMDYVREEVVLYGYGRIDHLALDATFFKAIEQKNGKIKDIMPISSAIGGITWFFNTGEINGCFIRFENGDVACIQSDGEYIDICYGEKQ